MQRQSSETTVLRRSIGRCQAWAGVGKIVCTDLEHALPLILRNVAKNNVSEIVSVAALVLGNEVPPRIGATLVIASDVVY